MDDLENDQCQGDGGNRPENGIKRKRRYSSTQSDDSLTKRIATTKTSTIFTGAVENKVNNGTKEGLSTKDDRPRTDLNAEKCSETEFLLEEFCDEVLYEIFKFLDTWSLMALMK